MITNDNKFLLPDIGLLCLKFNKVFGKNSIYQRKICTQYIEGQKSENKVKTRNLNKDQKQFVRIQFEPPLC